MFAPSEELNRSSSTFSSATLDSEIQERGVDEEVAHLEGTSPDPECHEPVQSNDLSVSGPAGSELRREEIVTTVELHKEPNLDKCAEERKVEEEPFQLKEEQSEPETGAEEKPRVVEDKILETEKFEVDEQNDGCAEEANSGNESSNDDDDVDEGVDMDSLKPVKSGQDEEDQTEGDQNMEMTNEEESQQQVVNKEPSVSGFEGMSSEGGMCLMSNPELQKIRQEQVRKWLIFEQENPTSGGTESSLQGSMEADSLAAGASQKLVDVDSLYDEAGQECGLEEGADSEGLANRRVRFLTDQEGNLLISVFMTNSVPSTPISEDSSITLASGPEVGDKNETNVDMLDNQQMSPSLVVSPPSLDAIPQDDELVDSIEPSAPKLEELEVEDNHEGEDKQIVVVLDEHLSDKMPPQEKPPAPPADDSANESSDETLSVSSCNSMIEINRTGSYDLTLEGHDESESNDDVDETAQQNSLELTCQPLVEENVAAPNLSGNIAAESSLETPGGKPFFQLGVMEQSERREDDFIEMQNDEEEHSSLIIHEYESHDEGQATHNPTQAASEAMLSVIKTPNIDENNNVVDNNTIIEEDEEEEEEDPPPAPCEGPVLLQFNPEIGEKLNIMPELKRSASSSDGEGEEEHLERSATASSCHSQQTSSSENQNFLTPPETDQEGQMVSLCIQEEHISAVALTIAKWESLAKSQSNENLSTMIPATAASTNTHAPITKSVSTPCSKTSSVGGASSSPFTHRPLPMKPVQPVAPIQGKDSPSPTRVAIYGSNIPSHNEPLQLTKAAGWGCWGNNKKETGAQIPAQQQPAQDSAPSDEAIYAQPNHQAGSTMTNISNPSAILKSYPKPLSKGEILTWFKEGEIHRAGLLLNYTQSHHHAPITGHHGANHMSPVLVSWFFGLISRQQAERYLHGQPPGTFLVRISTRIWGYTLSYQAANGRIKHFLISAINPAVPATLETAPSETALPPQSCKQQRMSPFLPQGRYAFIGTNMTPYGTLISLIRHHSHAPITKLGGEKLLNPCRGGPQIAGLESVFQKLVVSTPPTPSSTTNAFMISSA